MPTAEASDAYFLLRYHLGWVDQQGIEMQTPISQGKALRPSLVLFACEALATDYSAALPAAAALELIHNFSLIHDDIQDQDIERRHQSSGGLEYLARPKHLDMVQIALLAFMASSSLVFRCIQAATGRPTFSPREEDYDSRRRPSIKCEFGPGGQTPRNVLQIQKLFRTRAL